MKKICLILAGTWIITIAADAKYRINRTMYDHHEFSYIKGDPYRPPVACITSLLMPGTGQIMCGELGRGIGVIGGCIGSGVITYCGLEMFAHAIPTSEWEPVKPGQALGGLGLVLAGVIGYVYTDIWSAVDASRVAKVNDLAFRYRNKIPFTSDNSNIRDVYKPAAVGFVTFLIPGTGQLFMDEKTRGLYFLGGFIGFNLFILGVMTDEVEYWPGILLIGNAGIRAWSAYDAARIATNKNLAYSNQDNRGVGFRISPYIGPAVIPGNHQDFQAGLTLSIAF